MEARDLITQADEIARGQGLTQAEWCRRAGFDELGKMVSNTFRRGNCKLTTFTRLLAPLGYEVKIVKTEKPETN